MLRNEIYEEYFLNSSSAPNTSNIAGFVMKYGGLDINSNCVFPLYEKGENNIENRVISIENFLLEKDIQPIYRIVYQENYEYLDSLLRENNYEKSEESVVLGCTLEGKKDYLFNYADFNENGIFILEFDELDDEFIDDYSKFKNYNRAQERLFAITTDEIPLKKYCLSLVEEGKLLGLAYFTTQEDVVVIKDIVISPEYRGLGYSSKILYSILTYSVKNDFSLVLAEVFLSNEDAVSLFSNNTMFVKLYDVFYRTFTSRRIRKNN